MRKVFRGECLIDSFVVRPIWMPPSARLNLCNKHKDWLSHTGLLWKHSGLVQLYRWLYLTDRMARDPIGGVWQQSREWLPVNKWSVWQPGEAHLLRWEMSLGLNGFYSHLNYFSLAIFLSRGACVMTTICGLKRRIESPSTFAQQPSALRRW